MWQVKLHKDVINEDFAKIPKTDQKTILKTIHKKLSINPLEFGEPLRHNLKGLRKLRISDYRVIFSVKKQIVEVYVLKIGMRRDEEVYKEVLKRL